MTSTEFFAFAVYSADLLVLTVNSCLLPIFRRTLAPGFFALKALSTAAFLAAAGFAVAVLAGRTRWASAVLELVARNPKERVAPRRRKRRFLLRMDLDMLGLSSSRAGGRCRVGGLEVSSSATSEPGSEEIFGR